MITIRKQGEESFQYESPKNSPDFSSGYDIDDKLYPDENGNWIIEWHDNQDGQGRIFFENYEDAKTFFDEVKSSLEEHGFKEKLPSNPKKRSERTNPDKENQQDQNADDKEVPSDNKKRSETVSPNNNRTENLEKNSKSNTSDKLKKHRKNPRYRALKKIYEEEYRDDWSFERQYLTFFFGQYLLALPGVILGEILLPAIGIGGILSAATITVTDITWESIIRYLGNEQPMTLGDVATKAGIGVGPSAVARAASSVKNVDKGLSAAKRASTTSPRPPTGLEKHELEQISKKYGPQTELVQSFAKGEPGVKPGAHGSETSHEFTSNWMVERAKKMGWIVEKEHLHDPRTLLNNNRRKPPTVDLRVEDQFRPDQLNMVVELKSKITVKNGRVSAGRGKGRKNQIKSFEQSAQRRLEKLHAIIGSEGRIAVYDPVSKTWSYLKQ